MNAPPPNESTEALAREERDEFLQKLSFQLAKGLFSAVLEDLWYGAAVPRLDKIVEVNEIPTQLAGQCAANGGFAGPHEAD